MKVSSQKSNAGRTTFIVRPASLTHQGVAEGANLKDPTQTPLDEGERGRLRTFLRHRSGLELSGRSLCRFYFASGSNRRTTVAYTCTRIAHVRTFVAMLAAEPREQAIEQVRLLHDKD